MITDADIKKLSKVFMTKVDFRDGLRTTKTELLVELSKTRYEIIKHLGDLIHDELLSLLDRYDKRIHRVEKRLNLSPLSD